MMTVNELLSRAKGVQLIKLCMTWDELIIPAHQAKARAA
jgi:hypothetical protein